MSENWPPPTSSDPSPPQPGWGPPSSVPSDPKAERQARSAQAKVERDAKSSARKADNEAKGAARKAALEQKKATHQEAKQNAVQVKADAEAALLARRGRKLDSGGGWMGRSVVLYERCIEYRQTEYPLAGARATVETEGGVSIAKNRTLKTGLLHSKKTTVDTSKTYLTIETTAGQFVVSESGDGASTRSFAARVNSQALQGAPAASPPEPTTRPVSSVAEELSKLAGLRDRGILTEAEFEVQKARLLG